MDRYSHHNYNSPPPSGAFKRFFVMIIFVLVVIALGVGLYKYKTHFVWMQKVASNVISIAHENTADGKNDPTPPIHFEFYTALANAQMAEDHTTDTPKVVANKAEASLHKELEKEISEVANQKGHVHDL